MRRYILTRQLVHSDEGLHVDPKDALDGLCRADQARYNSSAHDLLSGCLEGTRVAVLQQIHDWIEDLCPDQPRLFLLTGVAGIGKTSISINVCKTATTKEISVLSFFFSRTSADPKLRDPTLVFPTLAHQLSLVDSSFAHHLAITLSGDASLPRSSIPTQQEKLFVQPLLRSESSQRILIVLDAFDECDDEPRTKILLRQLILGLSKLPRRVKFFLTSRPEIHVRAEFRRFLDHVPFVLHEVEKHVVNDDIRRYLRWALDNVGHELDFDLPEAWFEPCLDTLVNRSNGLFIYAATTVRFIEDSTTSNPERQLRKLLEAQTSEGEHPHTPLDGMYLTVLQQLVRSPVTSPATLRTFQLILGTLLLMRGPMGFRGLDRFLELSDGGTRGILNQLHSVIIPPSSDDEPPRTYHQSFPDFLTNAARCTDPRFYINVPDHEQRLACRCLDILNTQLKRDIAGINDPLLLNCEVEDFDLKVQAIPPDLVYACKYWSSHLRAVPPGDTLLVLLLSYFANRRLLWYAECLSLIGYTRQGTEDMEEVLQWAVRFCLL